MIIKKGFRLLGLLMALNSYAQDATLTMDAAIAATLENNLGLKTYRNQEAIASNNQTWGNAGLLPSLDVAAGASYSNNNTELEIATQPEVISTNGAESTSSNASISGNYVLFGGFGGYNRYIKLIHQSEQATQVTKSQVEGTLIQVLNGYVNLVTLQNAMKTASQSMEVSEARLKRTQQLLDYGQANTLDLLSAEVDLQTDSVNLAQQTLNFRLGCRSLNYLMGLPADSVFAVDSILDINQSFDLETLTKKLLDHNAELALLRSAATIAEYDVKIARSRFYPIVSLSSSYGYSGSQNEVGVLLSQQNIGFTTGVNVSFNLFNGKQTQTAVTNAEILLENQTLQIQEAEQRLLGELMNAYDQFTYGKTLIEQEEATLRLAQRNLSKNEEQLRLGLINPLQYREAQLNLRRAQERVLLQENQRKIAELEILRLTGQLVK